jgi:hypothetical protein
LPAFASLLAVFLKVLSTASTPQLKPLEGCFQGRGGWCRLVEGRKEGAMIKSLQFGALL